MTTIKKTRAEETANPVDVAIGNRVRASREAIRMSQQGLAGGVLVTFQQIQKYERGINRISAARLIQIASALGVTGSFLLGEADTSGNAELARLQSIASGLSPVMLTALADLAYAMRGVDAAKAAG